MTVCGVIAEYDPFHRGHARHLRIAREKTGAEAVVCVISGSFTQRGLPALLPPQARAEMALGCGADAVLQLPYAFSVREAEYFALGGVSILSRLNCVTHLSFGCETENLALLQAAAALLEAPDEALNADVQAQLSQGLSFAAAQGRALEKRLCLPTGALNAPNTALALCYLRALKRLNSPLIPVPVLRPTDYHAAEMETWPSASAVRGALLRGDWAGVRAAVPEEALPALMRAVRAGICPPDGLDAALRHTLLTTPREQIAAWPGVGEGLEGRILKAAQTAVSREELIALVKTRRYTWGRLSRALCHGLMGVTAEQLPLLPDSARLLGFRESARHLLRCMQESGFPLITRLSRQDQSTLDARADALWQIGAGLPQGDAFRRETVRVL